MKKVLSYIVLAGLALLSIASCKREEMAILDPANATAPVLTSFTVEENAIVAQFTPGAFKSDYNKNVALSHALVLVEVDGTKYGKTLNSKVNENTISVSRTDLCKALMGLGYADGATVGLKMAVRATAQNPSQDNGINGYIDSKSTIDIAAYEIYLPQGSGGGPQIPKIDLSQYEYLAGMEGAETWGIIGPAVSDWSTDVDLKKISNDPEVWYASSVPFVSDSFKFRGNDEWGDYDLGGGEYALDTPIVMSKGGGDMTSDTGSFDVYLFPTYGIAYITAGTGGNELPSIDLSVYDYLDIMAGADTWGVIGPAVSDWSTDVDLEKISEDPEIWCAKGMPFQEDSFKFRGNDTWADYDLGGGVFAIEEPIVMTKGGGDMTAQAGNYDVYLYPTYGVAYLKPAGGDTPPPPEKPKAWSLIGTFEDSGWGTDYDLENTSGNTWVIKNMFMREGEQFKIRADHAWNKSFGGPEANLDIPDGEGTKGVYQPTIGETFTAGGVDIYIPAEGYYNVTLNYGNNESTILIEEYKEFPDHVYMIGQDFGAWDWGSDGIVELVPVVHQPAWGANAEAQFWTVKYLKAGSDHGFKFCSQKAWNGDFWGLDENDGFVEAGGNCTVEEDGNYLIHIDFKRGMVHIEPARVYGIGACFGNKWDENMEDALFQPDGEKLKITIPAEGELRMYVASSIATSDWWTREFIFMEDGVIDYRGDDEGQGDQARRSVLKDQVVVLDFNAGTGAIEGEGVEPEPPAAAYMIGGQFGNWTWASDEVVELIPVWGTTNLFWCTRWFDASQGFKFNTKRDWGGDFTGEGGPIYTVGEDNNCHVPADGLYTVLVNVTDKTVEITEAEVYGLGDAVFTGGWDFDSAQKFEVEGDKFVLTTSGAGELRLSSKVMPSAPIDGVTTGGGWIDWWKTEFIFFEDCKIDYRGAGPDQARRQVEAGKKIVIDFNAGTAYFEGEVPPPPANDIIVDGLFADWAGIAAGLSSEEGPYLEFKATNDDEFIYLYSKRTWHDGLWKDSSGGYYYFEFDTDNDSSTGTMDVNGNTGFGVEAWMYLYLFTGTKDAPTFASNPAGSGYPSASVIENVIAAGHTDMEVIETEVRIPMANIGVAKGQTIKIYTWGNKSAGNLKGEESFLQITLQ